METTYSRELMDAKLDNILLRIAEIKDIATATHDQAKRTNGRVTKLEGWRLYVLGAFSLVTVIFSGAIYIYKTEQGNQDQQILKVLEDHAAQTSALLNK